MFNSHQSSDSEFAASSSDEDSYISNTTDYLSTDNEESCSTCQDSPPKNGADNSLSEQKDGTTFDDSSSAHVGDLSSSDQVGDSRSSVSGTFIHLANGTILCDLGGCGLPRKKAKVDSSKKITRGNVLVKRRNVHTDILKNWMQRNLEHPYPSGETKIMLVRESGLTLLQVKNWMINARRRYYPDWCHQRGVNPMVVKRNRRGLNGSQSSSENKENGDPFPVSDSGLNQNSSLILLSDVTNDV